MFCKNCGNEMKDGVKFCSKCGMPVNSTSPVETTPVSTYAQVIGQTYTFKNTPNTNSIIRYFKGGQVIFKFDEDKFTWQRELQYDEEVISVPYYLIDNFKFENKVSVGMVSIGIFALLCSLMCFLVCMNLFLKELSEKFSDDVIVLICDGARWHKSKTNTL